MRIMASRGQCTGISPSIASSCPFGNPVELLKPGNISYWPDVWCCIYQLIYWLWAGVLKNWSEFHRVCFPHHGHWRNDGTHTIDDGSDASLYTLSVSSCWPHSKAMAVVGMPMFFAIKSEWKILKYCRACPLWQERAIPPPYEYS